MMTEEGIYFVQILIRFRFISTHVTSVRHISIKSY